VFLGNSITEFWFSTDTTFSEGKPYINRGISGQTSLQMLIRFRQDVIDLQPSVVVILAGINDIAENMGPTTPEAIIDNIISMTELALANDIRVVLCSVLPAFDFWWRPGLQPAEKIETLNRMIASYCREKKIEYVDYHTPMADERKGLQYVFGEDGVHPNLAGYRFMKPLVEAGIANALKRK
jgi:lysophospholipase L1-like esterase